MLVAKGYTQREGLDSQDNFSPVAKMVSIRIVLSLAASHSWDSSQMDVNNAYLQHDLLEAIYIELSLSPNHW